MATFASELFERDLRFVMEDGNVTGMTNTTEEGEYWLKRC